MPHTPEPVYAPNTLEHGPRDPAKPMDQTEKARWRAAAARATTAIPGPVGELVARELLIVEEFGWALGRESLIHRVRADIEARPVKPHIRAQSLTRGPLPSA